MYRSGKETEELQNMYNFGSGNDDDVAQRQGPQVQVFPTQLEEFDMRSDDDKNDFENAKGVGGVTSPVYSLPASPDFDRKMSLTVDTEGYPLKELKESEVPSQDRTEKQKENSKLRIAKEILGLNNKNINGMSPSEKERVLLEERWKNAIAEENRLDSLEERVRSREQAVAAAGLLPNFPPKFLCIRPLVHHDITTVPELRKRFVKLNYMNWIVTSVLLAFNMFVVVGIMCAPYRQGANQSFNMAKNIALSILYLSGGPLSFIVWYWQVYVACSTGRHTRHLLSLSGLILALSFSIFMIIGKTNAGTCGINFAMSTAELKSRFLILPIIIVMVMWFAEACFLVYCIVKQWVYYRLDVKAQQEVKRQMGNVIGI